MKNGTVETFDGRGDSNLLWEMIAREDFQLGKSVNGKWSFV